MKWTRKKPTAPGWYWYRDRKENCIARVTKRDAELYVAFMDADGFHDANYKLEGYGLDQLIPQGLSGWWKGPLSPEET